MADSTKQSILNIGSGSGSGTSGSASIDEDITVYGVGEVGGYKDGDVISKDTDTLTSVLKTLFQKVIHPTYKSPTLSLSVDKSIVENNVETSITITPTFTQNHAGAINNVKIYRGSDLLYDGDTLSAYTDTYKHISNSASSIFNYKYVVSYDDGTILQNNVGVDDETGRILAGSIEKTSSNITSVAPTYTGILDNGTVDVSNITKLTKSVRNKSTLTQKYTTNGNQTVVLVSPWELTSIINQNNYEVISNFTKEEWSVNGLAHYYVYSLPNVNLDNFQYTFKY